jgi:photosystem II stability/assembly factor-like uncharacterized protein
MGTAAITFACVFLLGQLLPVDPSLHSDDFISISCPDQRSCLILDNAGNVWFSPGGATKLVRRSDQRQIGLVKIRFSGLIDGWGLDRSGGLWQTRNGGRSFLPIPPPGGSPAADIRSHKEIWLGTRSGSLYRLHRKKEAVAMATIPGATGLKFFDFNEKGLIAAVATDGSLLVSEDQGGKWNHTRPVPGDVTGLAVDGGGHIVVSGCRGDVNISMDQGKTFHPLKLPATPESWGSACLTSGGFLADGRFLLFGIPGNILVGHPDSDLLVNFSISPERNWRDAAFLERSGALLVGNGGARVHLKALRDRKLACTMLGASRSTITDTQVFNRRHVWVAYMNGEILYSADEGKKWEKLSQPVREPIRISFVDEKRGFALMADHGILGTKDGGRSWKVLGNWPDTFLNDVFFIDAHNGWAVGKMGCVVRTTNGGNTWTLDRLPTDRDLNRVQFVDRNRGWAIGDKQAVFSTTDGGRHWSRMLSGRGSLYAMHFEPSGEGWVCGDAGVVLHTTDGGKSWTPQPAPTHETLRAMSFLGSDRGLVGGEEGQVFVTVDGGNSWKRLELHTRTRVVTISCDRRAARCIVGGDRGLLYSGIPFCFHP